MATQGRGTHTGRLVSSTQGIVALARQPLWRRWTLASFLARLPATMSLLALILAGEAATGSLAVGASLAGAATVTAGLAAPLRGRQLDRRELRGGLQRACLATAGILALEALAVAIAAPVPVLFGLAVVQGLALAAISGAYRALLVPIVPAPELPRAYAVESVFAEIAFVSGPALAGVLAYAVGPVGVLVAMAASSTAAAVVTRGLPRLAPHPVEGVRVPWWRTVGVRAVYGIALLLGVSIGGVEAALAARVEVLGAGAEAAGPLLALVSAGSAVGGLAAATRDDLLGRHRRKAALLLVSFGVLLVPVGLAGNLPLLGLALFAAGLPIAPLNAIGALLVQRAVAPGRLAEGFAVFIAAIFVGAGLGQLATGLLLDQVGPQSLLLAAGLLPAVGGVAIVLRVRLAQVRRRRPRTPAE